VVLVQQMAKDYDQWYIDIVNTAETPERGIITVRKLMEKREEWEDATAYCKDKRWFYKTGQHNKNKEKIEMSNPSDILINFHIQFLLIRLCKLSIRML